MAGKLTRRSILGAAGGLALQPFLAAYEQNEQIRRRSECRRSLAEFVKDAWPVIDPGEPLVWGAPMDAICDHVQAVDSGHITRLLITVPPGFSKSTITNVMYPAWAWLRRPHLRFIAASYSDGPTKRDNDRCRRIIKSEWYQGNWGRRFEIVSPDQASYFGNNKTGWKLATSVGGQLLGWRGNVVILDDPNNPVGEDSTVRTTTNIWFREVVPSRLNNMARDAIIVIQQRLHLEDVAGTALDSNTPWVHLNIPMEWEPRRYVNGYRADSERIETFFDNDVDEFCREVFWQDWRTEENELAWPSRFPRDVVDAWKDDVGPTMVAAQLQQQPIPRGGAIIKSEWWQDVDESVGYKNKLPFSFLLASVDTAYTEDKKNDPSACTIWGLTQDTYGNPEVHLLDAWQEHLALHALVERLIDTCQIDDRKNTAGGKRWKVDTLLIEAAASGISVAQEIERILKQRATFGVDLCNPRLYGGDKVARLQSVEHVFARGTVFAPRHKDWADRVIFQCATVPYTQNDHLADTVAMAIRWLRDCGFAPTKEEVSEAYMEERRYRPRLTALYPA